MCDWPQFLPGTKQGFLFTAKRISQKLIKLEFFQDDIFGTHRFRKVGSVEHEYRE
jgi:hypothetical protein